MTNSATEAEARTKPVDRGGTARSAGAPPVPRRFLSRHSGWLLSLASLAVLLIFWEIAGRQINPLFASYPSAIAEAGVELIGDGDLQSALLDSLKPMAIGYVLASLVAVPVGLLLGRYRSLKSLFGMYVTAGYAMPMVALIPLFILWFGLGEAVKIAVVFVMTIFPIIINTMAGVRAVPRPLVEVGRSFMASERELLVKIIVPSTLPYVMTGLRLGVGRAVIGIVVAEFFTALGGLGGLIVDAGTRFDTATLFVPVIILMAMGVGLTAFIGWLERRVAPWHGQDNNSN